MVFRAKEVMSDGESLTYSIVKYAKSASLAKSKVSELEGRLDMLEMGSNTSQPTSGYMPQHQMQAEYFTPAPPSFQAPMPPTTIAFQPPHQQGSAQLQIGGIRRSNTGKRRKKRFHNNYNGQQWQ